MSAEKIVQIMGEITAERFRQDQKWGANRDQSIYRQLAILAEEVGEANEAALEMLPEVYSDTGQESAKWRAALRKELIQVAAVAVSIVEWIDRTGDVNDTD